MQHIPIYGICEFDGSTPNPVFYASSLSNHLKEHQFINNHHRHSTHVCILFTAGTGEHIIDFQSYPVNIGSMFFLKPGQVHCWNLSAETEGYICLHTEEFFNSVYLQHSLQSFPFYARGQNVPSISLTREEICCIENHFTKLLDHKLQDHLLAHQQIVSWLNFLYIEAAILRRNVGVEERKHSGMYKIQKLQTLIDEQYKINKSVNSYAEILHMTPRHLSRICNEILHLSASELIIQRIMLEAKRLLVHSGPSIAEVASELGYQDTSYFIRLFKKHTGTTPFAFQIKTRSYT